MTFDPKKYLIKLQGNRQYLPVSARLIWFREIHPSWGIDTRPVALDVEKQYAVFEASVFDETGRLMAKGTKMEDIRGFPDYIEKAETGAIGRALAVCGFGTQFAPELDEITAERYVDTPVETAAAAADSVPASPVKLEPDTRVPQSDSQAANTPKKHMCSACGRDLNQSQDLYSTRKFGVALCPSCQKGYRAAETI